MPLLWRREVPRQNWPLSSSGCSSLKTTSVSLKVCFQFSSFDRFFPAGISGVIGSAVFNIMFVISVCALCSGTVSYLNWWPLVRDCFFYALSILVMLFTIYNGTITW